MAAPTVTCIATARVEFLARTDRPELFCEVCTAYVGGSPQHHKCPGSVKAHVRDTNPRSCVPD